MQGVLAALDWASGCYGGETIVHVQGACQVYEHSGNMTFLNLSYACVTHLRMLCTPPSFCRTHKLIEEL